jgi:aryl-alcohol dehydrogenase-like predicted oxidoreductase
MEYTTLGRSDLRVSRVGLGLWNISGGLNWERTDERQAIETIHAAYEQGVTLFDTAEAYGDGYSEEVLGQALTSMPRDDIVVATKVWQDNLAYDDLRAACSASLDRLGIDCIDLYYVHYHDPTVPLSETMRALRDLQEEGKIGVPAVCNTGPEDLAETLSYGRVEANQVPYSLLWRAIEYDVLEASKTNDVDVVGYSPLAQGLLTGQFDSPEEVPTKRQRTRHFSGDRPDARHGEAGAERETFETIDRIRKTCAAHDRDMTEVALAWPLHQPGVSCVLAGASRPEHAAANARAAETTLSDALLEELDRITAHLKETLGPNPDPWQSDSRYR